MSPDSYFLVARILKIIIIVLGVIAVTVFSYGVVYQPIREGRRRKRKLKELFASRQSLSDREFYERFFESRGVSEEVVITVRSELEEALQLDIKRILPDDRFRGNLAFLWGDWGGLDGLESVWMLTSLEETFGIKITDGEALNLGSVEDLILLVWQKVEREGARI